jgi:hypothetical protein
MELGTLRCLGFHQEAYSYLHYFPATVNGLTEFPDLVQYSSNFTL